MSIQKIVRLACILCLATAALAQAAEADLRVVSRQMLEGDTKWDYLSFEPERDHLFITHGDRVDLYDTLKKEVIGTIPNTLGVHGVALAPELDHGYTSNGLSSTVTIFELSSLRVLGTLPTEKKPDAIIYDSSTKRVFVANGDSGTLTVIDALTNRVIDTVAIGGKLEFQAVDGRGRLYVNVEDRNVLAVVDTASLTVIAKHDISAGCDSPTGLSIDAPSSRLFVGCRNQKMAVVHGKTGAILASLPVGKGCDATAYDSVLMRVYASSGDGTLTVVDGETYVIELVVSTQPTARTLALDPVMHMLYAVAAEVETSGADGVRPKLKSGSFQLLTIGR